MGDRVLVDGGILSMDVVDVDSSSVACRVVDGGEMGSRRHINVRGKSANLPAITEKDWADIKWGIYEAQVDYFALSFVRDATVIHEPASIFGGGGQAEERVDEDRDFGKDRVG